jgi:hypothetical protein
LASARREAASRDLLNGQDAGVLELRASEAGGVA